MQTTLPHISEEQRAFHPASLWLERDQSADTGVPGRGIVLGVLLSVPLWYGIFALGRRVLALLG